MTLKRPYALISIFIFTVTSAGVPMSNHQEGVFSWLELLLILLLVILVVGVLILWNARLPLEYGDAFAHSTGHGAAHEPEPEMAEADDDLKLIEGIGPKISALFSQAGIRTFAQLAQADPAQLETLLREAGMRLGDPATWPEQARLAAQGEWEALEQLQDSLKGGRRE